MRPRRRAAIAACDAEGAVVARIIVTQYIADTRNVGPASILEPDPSMGDGHCVQLLEGHEYRYEIEAAGLASVEFDRPEIFLPDSETGLTGRLRTGLSVGLLPVSLMLHGQQLGVGVFEIRSRKLDYLSEYRWLLRDIARSMPSLVAMQFGTSEQAFALEETQDAELAYLRFAFLRSLILDGGLEAAFAQIQGRPHTDWIPQPERANSRRAYPVSSHLHQALLRGTVAVPGQEAYATWDGDVAARSVETVRYAETSDTAPNQFVLLALTFWYKEVLALRENIDGLRETAVRSRAVREADEVLSWLDAHRTSALLDGVASVEIVPFGSTILQNRQGYRELLSAFLLSRLSARLSWTADPDVFSAGQKNIARLYEIWCLFQVLDALTQVCEPASRQASIFSVSPDGLRVDLHRSAGAVFTGTITRRGRCFRVSVYYNCEFSPHGGRAWVLPMRPDISVWIEQSSSSATTPLGVWLHFDAKYRVDSVTDLFSSDENPISNDAVELEMIAAPGSRAKRSDLLRMHSYKDAIRRSAGAYILYPGTEDRAYREYHELLPGLGAFALRPSEAGDVFGADGVRRFLSDVVEHLADQTSQHERYRYWRDRSFGKGSSSPQAIGQVLEFLDVPPADALVLLGYVKSEAHLQWILTHGLYNLRSDGRRGSVGLASTELAAGHVLLYGPTLPTAKLFCVEDGPILKSDMELRATNYPMPRGSNYLCLPVKEEANAGRALYFTSTRVAEIAKTIRPNAVAGAPRALTWEHLLRLG